MEWKKNIKKLLLGNASNKYTPTEFYKKQIQNLKSIWNSSTYKKDFGIERLFRIFLQLTAFLTPSGFVRYLTGTDNLLTRKLGIEVYGLCKIVLICICFKYDLTTNIFALIAIVILSIDTLHFLISRVFLTDVFREPISHERSLMMTLINYVEICLCFGFVYSYLDDSNFDVNNPTFTINEKMPNIENKHLTDTQTIYFSFVTAATIGYGDISPRDSYTMKIIIVQILVSLFFVVVFISNIINKLGSETFYNKKKKNTT